MDSNPELLDKNLTTGMLGVQDLGKLSDKEKDLFVIENHDSLLSGESGDSMLLKTNSSGSSLFGSSNGVFENSSSSLFENSSSMSIENRNSLVETSSSNSLLLGTESLLIPSSNNNNPYNDNNNNDDNTKSDKNLFIGEVNIDQAGETDKYFRIGMNDITPLNWEEISALLQEVENDKQFSVGFEEEHQQFNPLLASKTPTTLKRGLSIDELDLESFEQGMNISEEKSSSLLQEILPLPKQLKAEHKKDPAPLDSNSFSFDEVKQILLESNDGKFRPNILKRFGVSPLNPNGPRYFYVLSRDSCGNGLDNVYHETNNDVTKPVRLRSTKKQIWFDQAKGFGLKFRELAKKERKTGELLDFGGCQYELVQNGVIAPISFLQIWELEKQQTLEENQEVVKKEPTLVSNMTQFIHEQFNKHSLKLQPWEFTKFSQKYAKLILSQQFAKAVRIYSTKDDPRLQEKFLVPDSLEPHVPIGIFKAKLEKDHVPNGGVCIFTDSTFREIMETNPIGEQGFFLRLLSPLQRLCIAKVFVKRMTKEGKFFAGLKEYFKEWRVSQCSLTTPAGTKKVIRFSHKVTNYADGTKVAECKLQDLSHLYPEIISLPPLLRILL